jgi:hypothetical protein
MASSSRIAANLPQHCIHLASCGGSKFFFWYPHGGVPGQGDRQLALAAKMISF